MEVVIPKQDFNFTTTSALSSPYSTGPPTPRRFGDYFYSAPTSPARMSDFYHAFDDEFSGEVYMSRSPPAVPYEWQYNPADTPSIIDDDGDFAFEFSQDLERTSLSADELFDGGKIKPIEPPPARSEKVVRTTDRNLASPSKSQKKTVRERGRERISPNSAAAVGLSGSSSGRRSARSLSPLRVSQYPWEEDSQLEQHPQQKVVDKNNKQQLLAHEHVSKHSNSSNPSKGSSSSSSKKWRLRDFLLFRSASEGRATDKDPLRKFSYSALHSKKHDQEAAKIRSAGSFGSGSGSGSGSGTRRKVAQSPAVSAHERHYTANKAASEGMKKKTFLPYKQGILGRLAFNPAVHALSNGFGSFTRS